MTEAETSAPAFGGRIDLAALKSRSTPLFGGEDYQVYVDAAQAVGLSELDIRELERCLGDALRDFNWAERTLAEVRHTSETLSIVVPRFPDIGREIFQALSSQLESSFGAEVAGELLNFKKHGFYSPLQQLGLRRRTVEIQKRFTGEGTFYDYVSDWYVVHEFEGRSGDPTRIQDIKSLTHKVSNARRDVLMEAIPNFVGQVPGTF